MSRRFLSFVLMLLIAQLWCAAYTVDLAPVSPDEVGSWAEISLPIRLHPNPSTDVRYEGPELALSLWGDIRLGTTTYPVLLGIHPGGEPRLWVDAGLSSQIGPEDELAATKGNGYVYWHIELTATPEGAEPFPYPIRLRWPEGRGYLFLDGGNPRMGTLQLGDRSVTVVLVDGDITGAYGTGGDFYAIDLEGDGRIHAEKGDHERFAIDEPFTLGDASFVPEHVAPDGRHMVFAPAPYVPPKVPLVPGSPAPEFVFEDYVRGDEVALSDLRGNVVLIDFWATWCPPCMDALPGIVDLYDRFRDEGFEIVGVSLDTHESSLQHVLREYDLRWLQHWDGPDEAEVAQLYRVSAIPALFLLDHQGRIRYRDLHGEDLESAVAELIAERSPAEEPEPPDAETERGPILALSAQAEAQVDRDGPVSTLVVLANPSSLTAQDIRIAFADKASAHSVHPEAIDVLHPGEKRTVQLQLDPVRATAPSEQNVYLSLTYRYEVGGTWTDIVQVETVPVAARAGIPELEEQGPPWPLWVLAGLAAAALLVLVLTR